MKKEEAIQWLTNEKWKNANNKYKKEWNEAFDMAIEALSDNAVSREHHDMEIKELKHQIKDQAVQGFRGGKIPPKEMLDGTVLIPQHQWLEMERELAELKPNFESADAVQGEWIEKYNGNGWNDFWDYTCSNCGKKYERADAVLYHANYCPNCGARMKGGAE